MMENLFGLITLLPLPVWLAMLLFPRTRMTQRLVTSSWPFIVLGTVYLLLMLGYLSTLSPAQLGFSADAFRRGLADGLGFLAVWAHLLAFDLFAGAWIFRDARYWGIRPEPYLLATLFAGPVGLAAYLVMRRRRERSDPISKLN